MNVCNNFSALVFIRLCLFLLETIAINKNANKLIIFLKRCCAARGFIIYRTNSIIQRSCDCPMPFSCSCCQSVIILYTKRAKNLCVNFTYQRNGLNVDFALNSDTIKTRTVTNYKAFQFCVHVPGCLFSNACANVLELSQSSKSITACLRLDIYAKKQLWPINYDCINLSTELPTMSTNVMPRRTNTQNGITPGNGRTSVTEMVTSPMTTMIMSEDGPEETTVASEVTEMMEGSDDQIEQMTVD